MVHMLRADRSFVVAIQLEKAPIESWDHLLELDFHVAVLDIPQLCVEIGLYDALLAAPPAGNGTLSSRLEPWLHVYQRPCAELTGLITHFADSAPSTARWRVPCWASTRRLRCTRASA